MIVAISTSFADVSVDDDVEGFCPSRSSDLVRLCGQLYREALAANEAHIVVITEGGDGAVE